MINLLISSVLICLLKITLIHCNVSYFKNVLMYSIIRTILFMIGVPFNLIYLISGFALFFVMGILLIAILKILDGYFEGLGFLIAGIIAEIIIGTICLTLLNLLISL